MNRIKLCRFESVPPCALPPSSFFRILVSNLASRVRSVYNVYGTATNETVMTATENPLDIFAAVLNFLLVQIMKKVTIPEHAQGVVNQVIENQKFNAIRENVTSDEDCDKIRIGQMLIEILQDIFPNGIPNPK